MMLRTLIAVSALLASLIQTATAREHPDWSFAELLEKSDLVVIATPVTQRDANVRELLIPRDDQDVVTGVVTEFRLLATLKGTVDDKTLSIAHYRLIPNASVFNGPSLPVFHKFLPELHIMRSKMLDPERDIEDFCIVFLKRQNDGKLAFVTGQFDAVYSVKMVRDYPDDFDVRPNAVK